MAYLIKFSDNYSDEFDLYGFKIYANAKEYQEFVDTLKIVEDTFNRLHKLLEEKYPIIAGKSSQEIYKMFVDREIDYNIYYEVTNKEITVGFGTNEVLTYNSYKDFLSKFSVSEISQEEYEVIKRTIGKSFGETCAFYIADSIMNTE